MCEIISGLYCNCIVKLFVGTDRPTLKFLNRIRKEMCSHWYDLGLELLDDQAELDGIQDNNDANKCATKMFKLWLERHTSITWLDLFDALDQLGLRDVAAKIESTISNFTYKSKYIVYVVTVFV